jgi:hypothetical protein
LPSGFCADQVVRVGRSAFSIVTSLWKSGDAEGEPFAAEREGGEAQEIMLWNQKSRGPSNSEGRSARDTEIIGLDPPGVGLDVEEMRWPSLSDLSGPTAVMWTNTSPAIVGLDESVPRSVEELDGPPCAIRKLHSQCPAAGPAARRLGGHFPGKASAPRHFADPQEAERRGQRVR